MFFFHSKYYFSKFSLLFIFVIIAFVLVFAPIFSSNQTKEQDMMEQGNTEASQVNLAAEQEIELVMITQYVVGEDVIEKRKEKYHSLEEIKERYPQWEIVEMKDNQMVLIRHMEDISPACKEKAYFGLSPDGYLTLYKGDDQGKEVIETFFRIDIKSLESALPQEPVEQLHQGIPIQDLAEFNSVLSTFSEYATE